MESKNNKNSKKNKLEGAISQELGTDGLMSAFVSQIQSDKSEPQSKESSDMAHEKHISPANDDSPENVPVRRVAMIKNPGKKEWWISLGAFLTIIFLIAFFLWLPIGKPQNFKIRLADKSASSSEILNLPDTSSFAMGTPVYFFFSSDNSLKVKKLYIQVENLNGPSSSSIISSSEYNINPNWKSIETHFQKEFFEIPGKYRISVQNEKRNILAEKIFYIR